MVNARHGLSMARSSGGWSRWTPASPYLAALDTADRYDPACPPARSSVPKPLTSGAKAEDRFGKQDFVYLSKDVAYRCPAGEHLTWRSTALRTA